MSGQGLGSGLGGALGTGLGLALAPVTGGSSLMLAGLGGALGAGAGSAIGGGSTNQDLLSALFGGIGGGLTGEFDPNMLSNLFSGASGASGAGQAVTDAANSGTSSALDSSGAAIPNPNDVGGSNWFVNQAGGVGDESAASGTPIMADSSASGSLGPTAANASQMASSGVNPLTGSAAGSSGLGSWLSNSNNLKNAAIAAGVGLPAIEGLVQQFTLPKYNVQGNANSVLASNPSFNNGALPKYNMQNTATPYSGNWYTYGMQPEPSMYNAMPQAAATGGLVHRPFLKKNRGYAEGGIVHGYAMGGLPIGAPQPNMQPQGGMPLPQAPQTAMPAPARPQTASNPLAIKAAHKLGTAIGHKIGQHLKQTSPLFTGHGKVGGQGGGQDDAVPAKLSRGEFVVPAEVVSALGDGSSDAGGEALESMVKQVRAQKTSKGIGFPPKAKSPLSYIKKGKK